jgi:hypothetical protein
MSTGRLVASGFALLMGIGSILMSFILVMHFAYLVLHFAYLRDPGGLQGPSWRVLLFQATGAWGMAFFTAWLGLASGLGYVGLRLARRGREPGRPASLAASAARFSAWGLAGCGLDLALLAGMLAYRWTR